MGQQEMSISYQAVKSKVYRLIDALVEGTKTEAAVQASMQNWWKAIHPADRPVAQKYVLEVLAKSNASLGAMTDGLLCFKEFDPVREGRSDRAHKHSAVSHSLFTSSL